MNKRDAINEILLALNELPLQTDDAVEDIQIAIIVDTQLEITKKKILSDGWWFNTITMELVPNTEKYIIVPQSFLSVRGISNTNIAVRDWKLFDKSELSFIFENSVNCEVMEDILFDDIPYVVADYIVQTASLFAYINIIGNTDDIQIRREELMRARVDAIRENASRYGGNLITDTHGSDVLDRTSL